MMSTLRSAPSILTGALVIVLVTAKLAFCPLLTQQDNVAKGRVERAVRVVGGEVALRSLKTIRTSAHGYQNHLEDSEDPEGPYIPDFLETKELRDLNKLRMERETTVNFAAGQRFTIKTTRAQGKLITVTRTDGHPSAGKLRYSKNEWFPLTPEGALIAALDASDLQSDPDETLGSAPVHVVRFHWNEIPVRIFLNAYSGFLSASEIVFADPYSVANAPWGDLRIRMAYAFWELEAGGLHYPLNWFETWNGKLHRVIVAEKVELNPSVPAGAFQIPVESQSTPPALVVDAVALGRPDQQSQELAPGVVQIPGSWYVTLVRQTDGVVVIESPVSAGYSAKVLDEAAERFPGLPVKAVISSTNFWWHFAGIREYVARGIPVYVLDQNYELLKQAVAAPHAQYPDDLARNARPAKWHIVSERTVLGEGPNRLELIPARENTGQDLVTYFPGQNLLYTAELAQPLGPNGSFLYPHDLSSVLDVIRDNQLKVDTLIGMHMSPTPLEKLCKAVQDAIGARS
jgi:hypothetical protein